MEPDDRWLCPLPLHHVGGLNVLIRSAINRTTVVLHERFDAERVKATLEAGEVTLASLVPTMLARLRAAGLRRAPGPAGDRPRRRADSRRACSTGRARRASRSCPSTG